jgi:hypothetical protein
MYCDEMYKVCLIDRRTILNIDFIDFVLEDKAFSC